MMPGPRNPDLRQKPSRRTHVEIRSLRMSSRGSEVRIRSHRRECESGRGTGVDSAQDAAAAASHALDGEDGVADLEIDPNPIALALVFGQNEAGEHLNQEISPASPRTVGGCLAVPP